MPGKPGELFVAPAKSIDKNPTTFSPKSTTTVGTSPELEERVKTVGAVPPGRRPLGFVMFPSVRFERTLTG